MTKKKNLKFKTGDKVQVVSEPTWGKKSPEPNGWDGGKSAGVKVGDVLTVKNSYGDGDYSFLLEGGHRATVIHQRHLELAADSIDDPGDIIEGHAIPRGGHMHVVAPGGVQFSMTSGAPDVGDIVVVKDEVETPYYTSWVTPGKTTASRLHKDQRYKVLSVSQADAVTGDKRLWLTFLGETEGARRAGLIDADQLQVLKRAWQVRLEDTMKSIGALYTGRVITALAAQHGIFTSADGTSPPVTLKKELGTTKAPAPKKLTWHDVAVGDRVTAKSTVQTLGGGSQEVTHIEVARVRDHGWGGTDLYWKDLNLTIHRIYDSWQIVSIEKAADIAPKPISERRKPARVRVVRTIEDDGLWIKHEKITGQKLGVVEQGYDADRRADYWAVFNDGTKVRLVEGRDKVTVEGFATGYTEAEGKTHNPA